MRKKTLFSKYAIALLITAFNILAATQIQAQTMRNDGKAALLFITKKTVTITKFSSEQKLVQLPLKITDPFRQLLVAQTGWQQKFQPQVSEAQNREYEACLFGDSISSALHNTLGNNTYNFAIGGMDTVSLLEQLNTLTAANVKCNTAIIAMGTNDAQANISMTKLVQNITDSIALVKGMGATKVFLIPAFYSTVEASYNPKRAGTIAKVEEVNAEIRQVAARENAVLFEQDIQPLYEGQALRKDLTIDGVHLNSDGQNIYRQALLKITQGNGER